MTFQVSGNPVWLPKYIKMSFQQFHQWWPITWLLITDGKATSKLDKCIAVIKYQIIKINIHFYSLKMCQKLRFMYTKLKKVYIYEFQIIWFDFYKHYPVYIPISTYLWSIQATDKCLLKVWRLSPLYCDESWRRLNSPDTIDYEELARYQTLPVEVLLQENSLPVDQVSQSQPCKHNYCH